jgi:hypothetical protein
MLSGGRPGSNHHFRKLGGGQHGSNDFPGGGVVARILGHVRPGDLAVAADNHRAAELCRITDRASLHQPGPRSRERPLGEDAGTDQLAGTADLGACDLVRLALLVSEHRKVDAAAAAEVSGVSRRELSDQDQAPSCGVELIPGAVQLDGVSLAVNSTVVPQPHERNRAVTPEIAKSHLVAVVVGEDDVGERPRAVAGGVGCFGHAPILLVDTARST